MKKIRFVLLLLCFCMILPLVVACGKTEDKTDVDADKYYYDDSTRERAADSIPEDYDLENQTIGFFYPQPQEKFALGDGETTDIIYSSLL